MRKLVVIAGVLVALVALGQYSLPAKLEDGVAEVEQALDELTGGQEIAGGDRDAYEGKRGRIVRVVDGDTLHVKLRRGREVTVRLIGIDTPETKRPGTPVECGGPQATASMERLARGRVTIDTDEGQDVTDRYDRLLAYVTTRRGVDLAAAQVRAGWASTYVYGDDPFQRYGAYQRAQDTAESRGNGVWATCGGDFHAP